MRLEVHDVRPPHPGSYEPFDWSVGPAVLFREGLETGEFEWGPLSITGRIPIDPGNLQLLELEIEKLSPGHQSKIILFKNEE